MLSINDIEAARERIRERIIETPCTYSESLSRLTGCSVYLKFENLQVTGSFKDRGALNKLLQLTDEQCAAGVIAASAGNHAQGVAYVAQLLGVRAVIVMPETAPLSKIRGTESFGAEVVLHGTNFEQTLARAQQLQQQHGYVFVHAFNDTDVIAGQGTIGLEIVEQVPEPDMVVVPVGGGGLIAGVATALRARYPAIRVVGVEMEGLPAMLRSLRAGRVETLEPVSTLADGIAVARVGELTFPLVQQYVEQVVVVNEEETAAAIMTLLEQEKTLAEGAGAVGFAALQRGRIPETEGRRVVVVISGGNLDMTLLARIVDRGMESDGRLARLRVVVPDKPGSIARLAEIVSGLGANIFDISQTRFVSDVKLGETEVELYLETRDWDHVRTIVAAIRTDGLVVK